MEEKKEREIERVGYDLETVCYSCIILDMSGLRMLWSHSLNLRYTSLSFCLPLVNQVMTDES